MATTSARMIQRRRTAAQWTAENPVLAAGEIGIATGGIAPQIKCGDGITAWNNLTKIMLPRVLTDHDVLYAYPADMLHNGTLIAATGTDTDLPRITLADAATQRVKWVWALPATWLAVTLRFAGIPEVGTGGNIKFQFAYKLIALGEGDVTGAVTTIAMAARNAGGQFDWTYHTPSELANIATPPGGLGDAPTILCSLSRLGADASDTLAGGVSIGVVTATRVDL